MCVCADINKTGLRNSYLMRPCPGNPWARPCQNCIKTWLLYNNINNQCTYRYSLDSHGNSFFTETFCLSICSGSHTGISRNVIVSPT